MSRQTDRADARRQAKIDAANGRVAARAAVRKAKGMTPLPTVQAGGYPASTYAPFVATGKKYPFSNVRQNAKYGRIFAGHVLLQAAA